MACLRARPSPGVGCLVHYSRVTTTDGWCCWEGRPARYTCGGCTVISDKPGRWARRRYVLVLSRDDGFGDVPTQLLLPPPWSRHQAGWHVVATRRASAGSDLMPSAGGLCVVYSRARPFRSPLLWFPPRAGGRLRHLPGLLVFFGSCMHIYCKHHSTPDTRGTPVQLRSCCPGEDHHHGTDRDEYAAWIILTGIPMHMCLRTDECA